MLSISTDLDHYKPEYRKYLNNLLRPYIPVKRLENYNINNDLIILNESIKDSDVCLLPMDWNYYVDFNKISDAMMMIKVAKKNNKKIIIGLGGDYFTQLPRDDHIIMMYLSPYFSKIQHKSIVSPVIINDPLKFKKTNLISIRKWTKTPIIGFCGQSDPNLIISLLKTAKLTWKNVRFLLGLSKYYSGSILPPTYLRKKILDILDKNKDIETKFIRRRLYKGGSLNNNKIQEKIKNEFYCNIEDTDYTLCIRGTGNFSSRFYETLAMGRIPVFLNTDCILPFKDIINWEKHVVWVEYPNMKNIGEAISNFHDSFTKDSYKLIQKENRIIWEKYFEFSGYYNHLVLTIKKIIK